ncbi:TetR/AcrR family transcriptional regulator [Mycobacterium sp. OTB74]|uniref:TetR/AcrR family transcriptional regulator n=1 Tax=Mycobacterium sp. OTB74 TaxID=1853452 RepID=UPI00247478D3|nr:TetR/AcrR family transcriptional regulator [Mycobacterium sp. OTB74]MDH6243324.1 AcrR family transcriptional regulator [Mycobacterium sp. OTB74]
MLRTRSTLQRALMDLVEQQDLSRITIADVAERAGVSRSTFYDHYRDVHELAEAACTAMVDDLIDGLPSVGTDYASDSDGSEVLRMFFVSFAEHANLIRTLAGPQGSARVVDRIRRHAIARIYLVKNPGAQPDPHDETESPHDVPSAFEAGALVGVAIDWLQRGCPVSAKVLADQTLPLITALAKAGARRR